MISTIHEDIAEIIAQIYKKVNWKRMTSKKRSAADILTDRITVASHEPNIISFYQKLCNSLRTSNAKVNPMKLNELNDKNEKVMLIIREHTCYLALLAEQKAKENYGRDNYENGNSNRNN